MHGINPNIGEYLIQKIYETGVRHVFGVPGDYILNFYAMLEKSRLQVINTCDEQSAGFAADAYGRVNGLGVVCVTYNVGGLKLLNPAAGAMAEQSPLLIIAGAPGWQERQKCRFLHHKVKEYDDQLNLFRHVTVASTDLNDLQTAYREIDRVISEVITRRRPGYIELPRDIVGMIPGGDFSGSGETVPAPGRSFHPEAIGAIVAAINRAERPVIVAGSGIARNSLTPALRILSEKASIPIVTTILGKSAIDERFSNFLGVYAGVIGDDAVRDYVESSDCIILLGVLLTDVDRGANTAVLDPDLIIDLSEEGCSIGSEQFSIPGLQLLPAIAEQGLAVHTIDGIPTPVRERIPPFSPTDAKISVENLVLALNTLIDEKTILITEVGDAVMMSLDITIKRTGGFMSPAYYSSLGFSVPAAIGVQLASPAIRPLVLSGDGAFQMTGMEVSTAGRYHLNPVVVILNNGGFGTERPMIDGAFNDVAPWKYHRIPEITGCGRGYLVRTGNELFAALKEAFSSQELSIVEVLLDENDISPQLRRLCQRFSQGVKSEKKG
jgi:indolepyruvate decarboxylase